MSTMVDPELRFYNDLSAADQTKWANELVKFPDIANHTPLTNLAYLYHPITYLYCENDQGIPIELQKMMAQKVKDAGVEVEEEWCDASHSPFLSMPGRVLEVAERHYRS